MLSIQARVARYVMARQLKKAPKREPTPSSVRRAIAKGLGHMPVPKGVTIRSRQVGTLSVEVITPQSGGHQARALMYLHGGGYVAGSPETHRAFTARLALELNCEVWIPDYRLAPEHPFPVGLHDAADVWGEFIQVHAGKTLLLGGESAGGGLSLALCYLLRERAVRLPDQLFLLSAWLDIRMAGHSYVRNDPSDVIAKSHTTNLGCARHYAGEEPRSNPLMSPLLGDAAGLPRTYVLVANTEIFEDDSRVFFRQARAAGVDVTLEVGDGLWHAWPLFAPFIPEARKSIRHLGKWVRAAA
ncbi:MAG: alpha/beta hydrolase [Gammaproteobacteria bacterium]|nr:alpha/beta hydrolase [Gammaproteobacteria bacterium]